MDMYRLDIVVFLVTIFTICLAAGMIIKTAEKQKKIIFDFINNESLRTGSFSYDISFKSFPDTYNVDPSNFYNCTPSDPRKCSVSDADSCLGCKNLLSKCTHISEDIDYVDTNGNKGILPKNETTDEGYCLCNKNVSIQCNQYHGKLVLIEDDMNRVGEECYCKYPGYIDKIRPDGDCTTPMICGGKIDSIDKPLEEIKCECNSGFKNSRLPDGCPICLENKVMDTDYAYYYDMMKNPVYVDVFDKDIGGNIPAKLLPNPCTICPITGKDVDGVLIDDGKGNYQCASNSEKCIPLRLNRQTRILAGTYGPDCVLALEAAAIHVYGRINSKEISDGAIIIKHTPYNSHFYNSLNIDARKVLKIDMLYSEVIFPSNFRYVKTVTPFFGWLYEDMAANLKQEIISNANSKIKSLKSYNYSTNNQNVTVYGNKNTFSNYYVDINFIINSPTQDFGVQLELNKEAFQDTTSYWCEASTFQLGYMRYVYNGNGDYKGFYARFLSKSDWRKWVDSMY